MPPKNKLIKEVACPVCGEFMRLIVKEKLLICFNEICPLLSVSFIAPGREEVNIEDYIEWLLTRYQIRKDKKNED